MGRGVYCFQEPSFHSVYFMKLLRTLVHLITQTNSLQVLGNISITFKEILDSFRIFRRTFLLSQKFSQEISKFPSVQSMKLLWTSVHLITQTFADISSFNYTTFQEILDSFRKFRRTFLLFRKFPRKYSNFISSFNYTNQQFQEM